MSGGSRSIAARAIWFGACALLLATLIWSSDRATPSPIPQIANSIAGDTLSHVVEPGDSLNAISSRYGVAASLIAAANGIRRNSVLRPGQVLRFDNRHVVPKSLGRGILINIPQRMLFFFADGRLVSHYPVALGRPSWRTPVGNFTVIAMRENPTWIVPESIQREMEAEGKEVETCLPPGADNPLGHYALDLSIPGYRIHGTIAPASIYHFSTHGCVRLRPDDIEDLYTRVRVGEPGEIIYEPVMLASLPDGRIFLEVNRDTYRKMPEPSQAVHALVEIGNLSEKVDWNAVDRVVKNADGIAREVDRRATAVGDDQKRR